MGWHHHSNNCLGQIHKKAKQGAWSDGKEMAQQLPPLPGRKRRRTAPAVLSLWATLPAGPELTDAAFALQETSTE